MYESSELINRMVIFIDDVKLLIQQIFIICYKINSIFVCSSVWNVINLQERCVIIVLFYRGLNVLYTDVMSAS